MSRLALLLLLAVAVLGSPGAGLASERHPTLAEVEREVICPTCHTTLDQSDSPIARRMKAFIVARIAAGDTKGEIKAKLVAEFGPGILADPPKRGFNLIAWLLPLVGGAGAAIVLGVLGWRWTKAREPGEPARAEALSPELERRVDDALARFDG